MADTHTERWGADGPLCKSWAVEDKANMSRIKTQQTLVIKCGMKVSSTRSMLTEILEGKDLKK
jgi:hypothetical protein